MPQSPIGKGRYPVKDTGPLWGEACAGGSGPDNLSSAQERLDHRDQAAFLRGLRFSSFRASFGSALNFFTSDSSSALVKL